MDDPRDRVTETAFRIAPELLGARLATPKRRLFALLLDLMLAATLAELGGGFFVGIVAAVLFYRVIMRSGRSRPLRRVGRSVVALFGAIFIFGLAVVLTQSADTPPPEDLATGIDSLGVRLALSEAERLMAPVGGSLDDVLPPEVAAVLEPFTATHPDTLSPEGRAEGAAVLHAFADAFASRDSVALDSLHATVRDLVAGAELHRRAQTITTLETRLARLKKENERLTEEIEHPSFLRSLKALAADFGLSLGWFGLYFTLVPAWWNGYTPGKRLFRIRVYRLDARPMTLWAAFERFGGYAAGLATGLLGFAQVFWDPNRQGIHDKISGTVVVRMKDARTVLRMRVAEEAG
ncbi:RDD family protein [Rhodocaloribacter sp.]